MLRQGGNVRGMGSLDILADSRAQSVFATRHIRSHFPLSPFLSSLPCYIFNFHIKSLSPSFFMLLSLFLYLSLSRLQCWLELSSTDSNRH